MLSNLRSKLILAFAAIIFICLFSAGTARVSSATETEQARGRSMAGATLALQTYLEWLGR
jgi:hypothetical protein